VKSTQMVSPHFNSRMCSSRHYIYRLIIPKSAEASEYIIRNDISPPITETNRSQFVRYVQSNYIYLVTNMDRGRVLPQEKMSK